MSIIDAQKIWDIDRKWLGKHSPTGGEVHPDLIRFKGHWYCGFKETGRSRILRSADGEKWETVKLFEWKGGFVGRPYLSVAPEGALMVNTWISPLRREDDQPKARYEKSVQDVPVAPVDKFYVTWLSQDGLHWSNASAHHSRLNFSVTWHNGICYGVDRDGALLYSCDGKDWICLTEHIWPDREEVLSYDPHDLSAEPGTQKTACNETALCFDPQDDKAIALARTNPVCAIIGSAPGPRYDDWQWQDLWVDWNADGNRVPAREAMGVQLGCPVVKQLSDGRLFGIGRADASDASTNRSMVTLFWINPSEALLTPFAKLDGYGGYAGVVEYDGVLWVACSNNSFPSYEVFLVKVDIPE